MAELLTLKFAFILLLAFISGFFKTTFGVGAGVFLTPIASLILDPKMAVALLAPLMLVSDITTLRYHWRKWDKQQLLIVTPFGLVGIFIGSVYLSWAPTNLVKFSIGCIAVLFSSFNIYKMYAFKSKLQKSLGPVFGACTSVIAGIAAAIAHSGGIILTLYLSTLSLSKYAFISTLTAYLFFNDILKNILFYKFGLLTNDLIFLSGCVIPALFLGSFIGKKTVAFLTYSQFIIIINCLIFVSGIILIINSVRAY